MSKESDSEITFLWTSTILADAWEEKTSFGSFFNRFAMLLAASKNHPGGIFF
jgi:hypothetical protein